MARFSAIIGRRACRGIAVSATHISRTTPQDREVIPVGKAADEPEGLRLHHKPVPQAGFIHEQDTPGAP
jgi:hypothetical protein